METDVLSLRQQELTSSIASSGRPRRAPLSVTTMGRLMSAGVAVMAASSCSSVRAGLSRPCSAYSGCLVRKC